MSKLPKPSAVIFAKDPARVAQFYRRLFSMADILSDDQHIVLDSENFQLVIHSIPQTIADTVRITEPPAVRSNMPVKLCLPVASIAQARAAAPALGGSIQPPDQAWQSPSFRACDGYDPEGNVIQFRDAAA